MTNVCRWCVAWLAMACGPCMAFMFSLLTAVWPESSSASVVAYYTFDDNTFDSTANKYDGAASAVTYSMDVPSALGSGKSLYWGDHSVRRYVDLPVVRGLGSNFTVTCWAKTPSGYTNPGGPTCILASSSPLAAGFDCWLNSWSSDDRKLGMSTRNEVLAADNASTASSVFSDNCWHHLAFVRSGTSCTIYIDGSVASMSDDSVHGDFPVNTALRIGQNFQVSANCNWAGWLDDFAIWDDVLSTNLIASLAAGTISPSSYMQSPVRAVAYYPLDGSAADAAGLGYDGTAVDLAYDSDVPTAIGSGQSATWADHTLQRYIDLPVVQELGTEFSLTCWTKLPSSYSNPGGGTTLFASSAPGTPGFQVYLNSWNSNDKKLNFSTVNDLLQSGNSRSATNVFSYGSWHHLALVRNGTNALFYVDGLLVSMADNSVLDDFPVNQALRIGQNFQVGTANNWGGQIDDLAVWNGALSLNLIQALADGSDSPGNHLTPSWWASRYVDEMNGFYRYQTITDIWLKSGSSISTVPSYMTSAGDFPYIKREYAKECYFTDEFLLVRALGGWRTNAVTGEAAETHSHISEFDVACKTNGVWQYRWDKLYDRIDPYYTNGYTRLTFVLDNTCWDFPSTPMQASSFGQAAPPADMDEWQTFIDAVCDQLAARYGTNTVGSWQFRVGTETHASVRFYGTGEEHNSFYDHTVAAVASRFPLAQIGPGNFFKLDDYRVYTNGWLEFIDHCATGTNAVSGATGSQYDFTSRSVYKNYNKFDDPLDAVEQYMEEADEIDMTLGRAVPREIHEYSIQQNELKQSTAEQGVYGAAWHMQALLGFYASGVTKIQHWSLFENISGNPALSGLGWDFMVLDHLRGGEFYELESPADSAAGTHYRACAVDKGDTGYLILTVFNPSRTTSDVRTVNINVPRDLMALAETSDIQYTSLSETNSLYDVFRADLADAGLLLTPWSTNAATISSVSAMGSSVGESYIAGRWSTYEQIFTNSLTLKTFPGTVSRNASNDMFTLQVGSPSIHVIAVKGK